MIDIGSGSGAILHCALSSYAGRHLNPVCIDLSPAVVQTVYERWPRVLGVIVIAESLPLAECSADIACSQFGIEYAGVNAIYSVLANVKCGGRIALVIHLEDGENFQECADNYSATREVQES